ASVGAGFRFIYARAFREYSNLSSPAAFLNGPPVVPPGLYLVCPDDHCASSETTFSQRVQEKSYLYAMTLPASAIVRLTRDAGLLLPLSVSPLIGVEHRNDSNVVYSLSYPTSVNEFLNSAQPLKVNRLDGTKFAYGVTADATLRWAVTESLT